MLAPLIKKEILWRLITGDQGALVRQLGLADSSLTHVAAAVRWIRDNYAEAIRVEDVAQLAGMSVSALYRNFHAVTAMSPIQFPEADPAPGGRPPARHPRRRRQRRQRAGGLREPVAVQPRVPQAVRCSAVAGRSEAAGRDARTFRRSAQLITSPRRTMSSISSSAAASSNGSGSAEIQRNTVAK